MQPGTVCKLEDIHYFKKTSVAWFVSDLVKGSEKERVHFTVHRGDKPIGEFIPASDDDSRVRDFRAGMELQEKLKREKDEKRYSVRDTAEIIIMDRRALACSKCNKC